MAAGLIIESIFFKGIDIKENFKKKSIFEKEVKKLDCLFITHLHSDHTLGLADLILTPWILGRKEPLQVYRPAGTKKNGEAYFGSLSGRHLYAIIRT